MLQSTNGTPPAARAGEADLASGARVREQARIAPPPRALQLDGAPAFITLVDRHIARGRRQGQGLSVLCMVADQLPEPRDGESTEWLLDECTHRLCSRVRATDEVVRYGRRHFGVLLLGANEAAAWAVSLRLLRAAGGLYRLGEQLLELRLRVGHGTLGVTGLDAAGLVGWASSAVGGQ